MTTETAHERKADILVIDDTRDNLRLLSKLLIDNGFYVRPVTEGKKALSAIQDQLPDLILLDIMMPDMDGYEVCRRLQADERTRDVPVIFISALNETFDKIKAFSVGGRDYIPKPFHEEEVLARVKAHLSLYFTQRRLEAEIVERKRIEKALRRQNRDSALLNRMSQVLQTCPGEQETYAVVADISALLFPESSGCILVKNDEGAAMNAAATWGDPPKSMRQLNPCDLNFDGCDDNTAIGHPDAGRTFSPIVWLPEQRRILVPVSSRDKLLAVLALVFESEKPEADADGWRSLVESKQTLIAEMAEYYALALVNLRLREKLRIESIHDPLTGLYNRRQMEAALQREINRARRHRTYVGILIFDIDFFKVFNDTYGHKAGDIVLKEIGDLLQRNTRGEDIACRYGGEEFLLILPNTGMEGAITRAAYLLEQVRKMEVPYREKTLSVTISVGVAVYPQHGPGIRSVVEKADKALYQAKNGGRNRLAIAM